MNTELRKNAKHDLSKKNSKLINNAVFGKTTENVRKLREIKLVPNRNNKKLCSFRTKQPYIKFFSDNLLAIEMERAWILINKPVYTGLSILESVK